MSLSNYSSWKVVLLTFLSLPFVLQGQTNKVGLVSIGIDELCGIAELQSGSLVIAHLCGVLRTEDNGVSWIVQNFPSCCGVHDMKFFGNVGIVIEGCRIWRSEDSGKTWRHVYDEGGWAIEFLDSSKVIAVGNMGNCFRSIDAGVTWKKMRGLSGFHLRDIAFYDSIQGIAISTSGFVNHTSDAGASWNDTICSFHGYAGKSSPYLTGVSYLNKNTLVAVSAAGDIFRSIDNGINWQRMWSDSTSNELEDVEFFDSDHGIAVGDSGVILHTRDGGFTWNWERYDLRYHWKRVHFTTLNEVLIAGNMGILVRKRFDW